MRAKTLIAGAFVLLGAAIVGAPQAANAHAGGETLITVAANDEALLQIDASIPAFQWRAALTAEGRDPESLEAVLADRSSVETYIFERVSLSDPAGEIPLHITALEQAGGGVELSLVADPQGHDLNTLELTWTLISDVVPSEYALVSTVEWPKTAGDPSTQLVASITHLKPTLAFSLGDAPVVPRATAAEVGFEHFRSGLDHVFIMLILAMGLTAPWARPRGTSLERPHFRRLAARAGLTSLAFACGHSISVVIVSTTDIGLPTSIIEISIAATIAIGALHALAADRGRLSHHLGLLPVAAIGLIHGFGFASALQTTGLSGFNLASSVLLFNLGLELAQLAALALFLPLLVFVTNQRLARTLLLLVILAISAVWILNRAGVDWIGATLPLETFGAFTPEWVAASIALAAGAVHLVVVGQRSLSSPRGNASDDPEMPGSTSSLSAD